MAKKALVAVLAALPLLASCAVTQPTATPLPQVSETATPTPSVAEVTPTPTPLFTPTPTPVPVTPSAPATPTTKPTTAPPAAPGPTTADPDGCANQTIRIDSSGKCVTFAQKLLKQAGYYSPTPGTKFGAASVNWTLQYQRSRGLADNGRIEGETWAALLSGKPQLPTMIPDSCKTSGVVICVSKAQGKLYWLQNGAVKKTTAVRFGGWNSDAKTKQWRLFGTPNGTYRVYNKDPNPSSENYGDGAMPYSTMFDPNMYVHYSAGFASVGYSGSSHGCVNVRVKADAKWIMDNTPIGAKVVVFSG